MPDLLSRVVEGQYVSLLSAVQTEAAAAALRPPVPYAVKDPLKPVFEGKVDEQVVLRSVPFVRFMFTQEVRHAT